MTTTYERVVPLTHYLWTSCAPSVIQSHKGTPMEYKLREVINKPLQVASSGGTFNDANYYKTSKILDYFFKNKITSKRQYILNDLVQYLNRNDMLPAICFIFSRKNVEIAAKEITHTLFDKDDKTPSIIEHECEKILMSKLKNYREYTMLDEYRSIVTLLKKGIAIHHAGIILFYEKWLSYFLKNVILNYYLQQKHSRLVLICQLKLLYLLNLVNLVEMV